MSTMMRIVLADIAAFAFTYRFSRFNPRARGKFRLDGREATSSLAGTPLESAGGL